MIKRAFISPPMESEEIIQGNVKFGKCRSQLGEPKGCEKSRGVKFGSVTGNYVNSSKYIFRNM